MSILINIQDGISIGNLPGKNLNSLANKKALSFKMKNNIKERVLCEERQLTTQYKEVKNIFSLDEYIKEIVQSSNLERPKFIKFDITNSLLQSSKPNKKTKGSREKLEKNINKIYIAIPLNDSILERYKNANSSSAGLIEANGDDISLPRIFKISEFIDCLLVDLLKGSTSKNKIKSLTIGHDSEYTEIPNLKGRAFVNTHQLWINELNLGFLFEFKKDKKLNQLKDTAKAWQEIDKGRCSLRDLLEPVFSLFKKYISLKNMSITYVAHYGLADLASFSIKYKKFIAKNAKKSAISIKDTSYVDIKPIKYSIRSYDANSPDQKVSIKFYDISRFFKKSLADIGDFIGYPKINVSQEQISNFTKFLKTDRNMALDYAVNDAFVTVKAYDYIKNFCLNEMKLGSMPKSLTKISEKYIAKYLGSELTDNIQWKKYGGKRLKENYNLSDMGSIYHGGRAETFIAGKYYEPTFDIDINSAYSTMMCWMELCDFATPYSYNVINGKIQDPSQLDMRAMGKFVVSYEFSDDIYAPYLVSYKDKDKGMFFTTKGENVEMTALEFIYCFKNNLFKQYYIHSHKIFKPYKDIAKRDVFIQAVAELLLKRDGIKSDMKKLDSKSIEYNKLNFEQLMFKGILNNIYGKTGQGVTTDIPVSGISNPCMAATITAGIRIMITEIINCLHFKGYRVYQCTTDGFICNVNIDGDLEKEILKHCPFSNEVLENKKNRLKIDSIKLLELKHVTPNNEHSYVVIDRLRSYHQGNHQTPEGNYILAKNGLKFDKRITHQKISKELERLKKSNKPHIQYKMPEIKNIIEKPYYDFIKQKTTNFVSFDVDHKRDMKLEEFKYGRSLWSSRPFLTAHEAIQRNEIVSKFKKLRLEQTRRRIVAKIKKGVIKPENKQYLMNREAKNYTFKKKSAYLFAAFIEYTEKIDATNTKNPFLRLDKWAALKMYRDGTHTIKQLKQLYGSKFSVGNEINRMKNVSLKEAKPKVTIEFLKKYKDYIHPQTCKIL